MGIISTISTSFVDQYDDPPLTMKEILGIEREIVLAMANSNKLRIGNVNIVIKSKVNFLVEGYFKMMSIVRNLMVNAVEATKEKSGLIIVELDEINDEYILKFTDNGRGMSELQLESIFLPGFSTKFSEDTGKIQRGIGLSVVKEYVEDDFDGKISVSSKKGEGTVFTMKFPVETFRKADKDEILHS